jgi:hypothetical protein
MKPLISALLLSAFASPLFADEPPPWLLCDYSNPSAARLGNVRLASKIEVNDNAVRLLVERDEKLVTFFESKDPQTIAQIRAQVHMAPTICIPVAGSSYVLTSSIASIDIVRRNNTTAYVLRGVSTELGAVVDPDGIRRLKGAFLIP